MPERQFDLGDYVEVKDRIKLFYELYAGGRLVTEKVYTELGPDGTPRVIVEAAAYRTTDDPLPGRGWSWMALPGTTSYTRGSELENTETSAWGRAIASTGILIDRSIASANEVENKKDEPERSAGATVYSAKNPPPPPAEPPSLIGVIEAGDKQTSDYQVRMDPDGVPHLGFRLKGEKGGILVEAAGDIAEDLAILRDNLIGQRVTAWGRVEDRSFDAGKPPNVRKVKYEALALARLTGPDGIVLPVAREAETVPLFSPDEEAGIDAAIGATA